MPGSSGTLYPYLTFYDDGLPKASTSDICRILRHDGKGPRGSVTLRIHTSLPRTHSLYTHTLSIIGSYIYLSTQQHRQHQKCPTPNSSTQKPTTTSQTGTSPGSARKPLRENATPPKCSKTIATSTTTIKIPQNRHRHQTRHRQHQNHQQ